MRYETKQGKEVGEQSKGESNFLPIPTCIQRIKCHEIQSQNYSKYGFSLSHISKHSVGSIPTHNTHCNPHLSSPSRIPPPKSPPPGKFNHSTHRSTNAPSQSIVKTTLIIPTPQSLSCLDNVPRRDGDASCGRDCRALKRRTLTIPGRDRPCHVPSWSNSTPP